MNGLGTLMLLIIVAIGGGVLLTGWLMSRGGK